MDVQDETRLSRDRTFQDVHNTMRTTKLLLVDDHVVVRKGLIHVLQNCDEFEVVGEAENGEEALHLARKLSPDVILMDVKMEGLGGIKTTELITQINPEVRVIGLSTFADRKTVDAMINAGASGYIQKHITVSDLAKAICDVAEGHILPYPDQLDDVASHGADRDMSESGRSILSSQQKKVLALLTKGFTNPEIAQSLGVSVPTARYHVSVILQKLDVSNRSEAAAMAVHENLVSPEDF